MADITDVERLASADDHLAVLAVARRDGSVQASVVNAGVLDDPIDGTLSVGLVAMGGSSKLTLLRARSTATVVFKHGWEWVSVSGATRLIGPDDGDDATIDLVALRRRVFVAAGGTHDDWDEYDRVMAKDRRCCVFVHAERISSNG